MNADERRWKPKKRGAKFTKTITANALLLWFLVIFLVDAFLV